MSQYPEGLLTERPHELVIAGEYSESGPFPAPRRAPGQLYLVQKVQKVQKVQRRGERFGTATADPRSPRVSTAFSSSSSSSSPSDARRQRSD
jgi:hypothetical protein